MLGFRDLRFRGSRSKLLMDKIMHDDKWPSSQDLGICGVSQN